MDRTIETVREAAVRKIANEGCDNEGVMEYYAGKGFDAALSLLQWKDVADGLPEVSGNYIVRYSSSQPRLAEYDVKAGFLSVGQKVTSYIPYPIPPYDKEQR